MVIFLILAGTGLFSYITLSWIGSYIDERMNRAIVVHNAPSKHSFGSVATDLADPKVTPPASDLSGAPVITPGMIPDAPKTAPVQKIEIPEVPVQRHHTESMETPAPQASYREAPHEMEADNGRNSQTKHSKPSPSIYQKGSQAPRPKIGFSHLQPAGPTDKNRSKLSTSKPGYTFNPAKTDKPSVDVTRSSSTDLKPKGNRFIKNKPDPKQIKKRQEALKLASIRDAREKRAAKVSSLSQLGLDFKQALDRRDNQQAEQVLEEIGRFKGRDSSYYLKLAAFKHICDGDYQKARQMLEQVLRKHPLDLDAGLNMAVIEIRTGETDLTRKRLERLKSTYPEDTRANALLGML